MTLATLAKRVKKNQPYEFEINGRRFVVSALKTDRQKPKTRSQASSKEPKIHVPTVAEKRADAQALKNYHAGKCLTLAKLKSNLGITD